MKHLVSISSASLVALCLSVCALTPEADIHADATDPCPGNVVLTSISAIQGSGASSPLSGSPLTTEGIVSGDYQPATLQSGFFIQSAQVDGDPVTSEGLFVYVPMGNALSSMDVKPGDRVRVSGTVKEYATGGGTLTELDAITALKICASGAELPLTPVALPVSTGTELEAYEGMLVTFPQELTVSETYTLGRYGELLLSSGGRLFNPTNGQGGTADQNALRSILLDDASSQQNPNPIPFLLVWAGWHPPCR